VGGKRNPTKLCHVTCRDAGMTSWGHEFLGVNTPQMFGGPKNVQTDHFRLWPQIFLEVIAGGGAFVAGVILSISTHTVVNIAIEPEDTQAQRQGRLFHSVTRGNFSPTRLPPFYPILPLLFFPFCFLSFRSPFSSPLFSFLFSFPLFFLFPFVSKKDPRI